MHLKESWVMILVSSIERLRLREDLKGESHVVLRGKGVLSIKKRQCEGLKTNYFYNTQEIARI